MPGPMPTDNSSVPAQQKPSLFRNLLMGAVTGILGGFASEAQKGGGGGGQPTSFGDDVARGFGGAVNFGVQRQQTQFQNSLAAQQVANDTQRTANDTTRANASAQLDEAQAALAMTQKLHLEKLTTYLPEEENSKIFQTWAQGTALLEQAGLQSVTQIDDTDQARDAFLKNVQAQGGKVTDYTFGPAGNGKITVLRRDPTKTLTPEIAQQLSSTLGLKIPAGLPTNIADNLISSTLQARATIKAAELHAAAMLQEARIRLGFQVPQGIENQMSQFDQAEGKLKVMQQLFQQHNGWVGGIMSGAGSLKGAIKEKFDLIGPDEAAFRTLVQQEFANQAHTLYGSAFTGHELQQALQNVPNLSMPPKKFAAAVDISIQNIQRARQALISNVPGLQARQLGGGGTADVMVRVRRKSDGATGTIPKSKLNDNYDVISDTTTQ